MFAIVKNNEVISYGELKVLFPSTSFPPNGPDDEWKIANNVKHVIDGRRNDDRFYFVSPIEPTYDSVADVVRIGYSSIAKPLEDREEVDQNGNPLYKKVFDPLANKGLGEMVTTNERLVGKGLKSEWIGRVKQTAGNLLQSTDWKIIREAEGGSAVDSATLSFRSNVRAYSNFLETSITNTSNVESLITIVSSITWPTI